MSYIMGGSRGGGGGAGGLDPPPGKTQNKGFHSNTGPGPLHYYIATKSAFNVDPSLARKRNAISMAFRWRPNDGPL